MKIFLKIAARVEKVFLDEKGKIDLGLLAVVFLGLFAISLGGLSFFNSGDGTGPLTLDYGDEVVFLSPQFVGAQSYIDPCAGITCNTYCSGTTQKYDGYCSAGKCIYASRIIAGTCGAICTPGTTRTRYTTSYASCGAYCLSETQTCNSTGTAWSGTYTGTSCTASTRTAYQALTSACGTYSYSSQSQTCYSTGWSGTYTLTSPPSTTTRTRYAALTSACGTYGSTSQTQSCLSSGSFSGTYTLTSAPSTTTRTRYAAATSACGTYGSYNETQSCLSSGSFSGTYTLSSPASITTRLRYTALTSACGTYSYSSETQSCLAGGSFSGTYTLTSAPSTTTRTRYAAATSACGTYGSNNETQYCQSSGSFSGTYTLTSPASITTRIRYQSSSVACGSSCPSETQSCLAGGSFSGTYAYSSCSALSPTTYYYDDDYDGYGAGGAVSSACVVPPGHSANNYDCDDNNSSIYHGSTRVRYQSSSVACGSSCVSQTQTCSYGSWSPNTYSYTSCSVSACAPTAPSGLTIDTATSQTQVTVRWTDNSSNESGFKVYRDSTLIATLAANTTSYTNSGLTCNTAYSYYVKATSEFGDSTASNSASRTTLPCTPATPSNLYITKSPTQINISWNDNSNNESYFVIYSNGSSVGTVGANVTSFDHTGLACSTSYGNYTVKACNASFCSAESTEALGATSLCVPTPISPPNNSWTNSRNFCASVTGYPGISTRARFVIGGTTYGVHYVNGSGTSCYTHTADLNGTTWYAYITDDASGNSGNSSTWTARIDTVAPTPNPPTVALSAGSSGSFTATVSSGSDALSGLHSTPYGFSLDGGAYAWQSSNAKNFTTPSGTSHTITAKIRDAAGNETSASGGGSIVLLLPPTGLNATFSYDGFSPSTERIDISWNAVSGATSYSIYERVNGGSWAAITPTYSWGATSKGIRVGTLSCGSTYEYYVVAHADSVTSDPSSSVSKTYGAPASAPRMYQIWPDSNSSVYMYWEGVEGAPRYKAYRGGALVATDLTQGDGFWNTGLPANTQYSYYLKPYNACGDGPAGTTYTVRTLGNISMSQSGSTQTSITACWSDSVNPTHPNLSSVDHYWIVRGSPIDESSGNIYPGTCWTDTELSCGTTYTYQTMAGFVMRAQGITGGDGGLGAAGVNSSSQNYSTAACDSTPPTFSISGSNSSWTTSASVTATASDVSGVSYVRHCWANTETMPPCDPGTTNANTFTNGATLSQTSSGASWYACFRARDAYGNWTPAITSGNYATYCWGPVRVDTTAPTPNPPTPSESSTGADSISVILPSGSDSHSGMSSTRYNYMRSGGTWTGWTSSGSYTFPGLSCETSYTISGKLRDAVGNETSAGSTNITTGSCVVPPATVSSVSVTEKSGGGGISVSWTNVGANGYRVYLRGGRSNPNSTSLIQDLSSNSITSYSGLDCPGAYSVVVVPYNTDATVGTDSSCTTAFSNALLSGVTVPTNRKCGTPTVGTVNLTSCTRGFLFE